MAEYIDIDTPLEAYRVRGNQRDQISTTLRELLDFNKIPYTVADVAPVRHGRWIFGTTMHHDWMKCSECLVSQDVNGCFSYCPNCGAKMDKEDTNGKTVD